MRADGRMAEGASIAPLDVGPRDSDHLALRVGWPILGTIRGPRRSPFAHRDAHCHNPPRHIANFAPDLAVLLLVATPTTLQAQHWVAGAELPLVRQASAQRRAQATDTTLAPWRATAHGLVRLAPV